MNREQFLRKIKKYARKNNLRYYFDKTEGDGSHGMLYLGDRQTIAKHGEWSKNYAQLILKQLGIGKDAI